ncbi:MAG: hypothetical protein ACPGYT_03230 [Nitrospirales bacterium]
MKIVNSFTLTFLVLGLTVSSAHPMDNENSIQFRGEIIDGPFKNQLVTGICNRNSNGDVYKQQTRCTLKIRGGYKIVDPKASLEVVGGNRALRIILGPSMGVPVKKGNFKFSAFQATTFYDQDISLFDIPRKFIAVDVSIGGVSVSGGTSTTNPDCLIWDIVGDGVF